MGKQKRKHKPKQSNFLCCLCFRRKRSSSATIIVDLSDKNEPYEYVVEKLAIKRVPLSLFATAEDLERHRKTVSSNSTPTPSVVSQKSEKSVKSEKVLKLPPEPLKDNPSVTFSEYYKLIPKIDIEQISHTEIHEREISVTEGLHFEPKKSVTINPAFKHRKIPKRAMSEDREKELVSQILNKHSSLFTLDAKNPIPKDPDHLPKNKLIVPPCIQDVIEKRGIQQFPIHCGRQVQVEIHKADVPPTNTVPSMLPLKSPALAPCAKKDMTPELKETINALAFAQKPHILSGFPPKNQRCLQETVSYGSTEQEICCSLLAGDEVTEKICSHEIVSHKLQEKEKLPSNRKAYSTTTGNPVDSDDDYQASSISKDPASEGDVPFENRLARNLNNLAQIDKSVLAVPGKSFIRNNLPVHAAVNTSDPRVRDSEQITEINQLKGQSLKWKIIIKHHSDKKKKEGRAILDRSDDSDTNSDSKRYMLRSRSSSPHR